MQTDRQDSCQSLWWIEFYVSLLFFSLHHLSSNCSTFANVFLFSIHIIKIIAVETLAINEFSALQCHYTTSIPASRQRGTCLSMAAGRSKDKNKNNIAIIVNKRKMRATQAEKIDSFQYLQLEHQKVRQIKLEKKRTIFKCRKYQ